MEDNSTIIEEICQNKNVTCSSTSILNKIKINPYNHVYDENRRSTIKFNDSKEFPVCFEICNNITFVKIDMI
jgi:hypothetical protein